MKICEKICYVAAALFLLLTPPFKEIGDEKIEPQPRQQSQKSQKK